MYHGENFEKMMQNGELIGCIFLHFLYKHNYVVSVEGNSIVLHIECLVGHVPSRKFLKCGTI